MMNKEHIVRVGPVHAGIIGPGLFKFTCRGERVEKLEVELGFQHRGIEALIVKAQGSALKMVALAEQIAGDTSVGHALAMVGMLDKGTALFKRAAGGDINAQKSIELLEMERTIALEMERMAVNIGDSGALMGDIAHQLGLVSCEALRTMVINTSQRACGSRYGRTWIRPGGSHYPLVRERRDDIIETLGEVTSRFINVKKAMLNSPSVLARLEELCVMEVQVERYKGDLKDRLVMRFDEVEASYALICELCKQIAKMEKDGVQHPEVDYQVSLDSDQEIHNSTKGWRGTINHSLKTDSSGEIIEYKIEDPSDKLWQCIADSMQGGDISDFPVNNKSFNLSYSGTDK